VSRAGRFVSFEGVEGCGKSTQLGRLRLALASRGVDVVATREPGGTDLGRRLRSLLLEPDGAPIDAATELLLYAADRAQHLAEIVVPALDRGAVVLCDRYLDATLAYQGHGRGLGVERVLELHRRPPLDLRPLRTVLLDLDPTEGLRRARHRDRTSGAAATEGRFEAEPTEFHDRVRAGYLVLAAAEPERYRVVDASGDADAVAERVAGAVVDVLPELGREDG